jgi:hypothetical protein
LLITVVYIGFTTRSCIYCIFLILEVHLIYRVSDKRLLERCGTGKGYLNETRSGSVRPPGLRIKRAEARMKGPKVPDIRQVAENRKRSFSGWVTGLQKAKGLGSERSETGARSFGKCAPVPEGHFVPESPAERQEKKDSRKVVP